MPNLNYVVSCDTTTPANFYTEKNVEYKGSSSFTATQDRSYSAWFRIKDSVFVRTNFIVNSFNMYTRVLDITFVKKPLFFVGDQIEITRTSTSEFMLFGTIIEIINQHNLKIELPQYVLGFVQTSYPQWISYTDLQVQKNSSKIFLSSIDTSNKGLQIELFGQRHFRITTNTNEQYFSIPNNLASLQKNVWYGLFVNFSNIYKQLTLNVWKIQWDSATNLPATTELTLVFNRTVTMISEDRSSAVSFYLKPSAMDLTNVRLFDRVAETDKQVIVLNQNIVKDAHLAIIIDNALPQSKLPYIGYTR